MRPNPWDEEDGEEVEKQFNEIECEKLIGAYYHGQTFETA